MKGDDDLQRRDLNEPMKHIRKKVKTIAKDLSKPGGKGFVPYFSSSLALTKVHATENSAINFFAAEKQYLISSVFKELLLTPFPFN